MPLLRRMRLLLGAVVVTLVMILLYTSSHQPDHELKGFYQKTKEAIDRGTSRGQTIINAKTGARAGRIEADHDGDGDVDDDDRQASQDLQQRLQAVAQEAKDKANKKGKLRPDRPSKIIGVGSSAEGQTKDEDGDEKKKSGSGSGVSSGDAPFPTEKDKPAVKEVETKEQHEAEVELNSILKKSPVIIFSKSYCPYSKRAKGLLLEKYAITPDPFVVELDQHPLGPLLQDYLEAKTGQRTVPNIMINGVSIGGFDDLARLDNGGKLPDKMRDLGQRRVEVSLRFTGKTE